MTIELRSCDLAEMQQVAADLGQPAFRAKQLFEWVHKKGVSQLVQMSNLGKDFLQKLEETCLLDNLTLERQQIAKDGTEKFLFKLSDGQYIECVLMRYRGDQSKQRNTICVSSQVGCAMGCTFCATGLSGFVRNLTVGEILGQIYAVNEILAQEGDVLPVGNVVFMGMGEPLLNFNQVLKAIMLLNDDKGQNISIRRITLSTCGIVPKMIELAQLDKDLVLAISLHAPNDELRSQMMPINKTYPLKQLMEACREYQKLTRKRISFEYALIKGVNDQAEHVQQLKKLLGSIDCHINVIPVNPVNEQTGFIKPDRSHVKNFIHQLTKAGLNASIREEKGSDIDGACGQLRGRQLNNEA